MKRQQQAPAFAIPTPLTPLLGREHEIVAVRQRLRAAHARLITLTGPGGVGKTRLGIEIVRDLGADFADGVAFVSLAPIRDPNLVISTIAQALGLPEASSRRPFARVQVYLRDRQLLLFLDNFEQVATAAPQLAELLVTCPGLKVLVASRAVLHISGEHEYPVSPLALPDPKRLPGLEAFAKIPAVALFIQHALAIRPDFQLTPQNAAAVAGICVYLDGLPLAIELAAARVKLLPPQLILERLASKLGGRFHLLTSGPHDLPVRQQTLRATLDWSYSLLDSAKQTLFRRLALFSGGFTLEVAEAVATGKQPGDASAEGALLNDLAALIDQSLLVTITATAASETAAPRYTMLETIREYGLDQLTLNEEMEAIRQAHGAYYLALAETAEPKLTSPAPEQWLDRLETEHDNLRAALHWSIERSDTSLALRLSSVLWWFWYRHGHWSEGRQWLAQALSLSILDAANGESAQPAEANAHLTARAKALNGAGILAHYQGDYDQAAHTSGESVALFRQLGDKRGIAAALHGLALVARSGSNYAAARAIYQESLALFQAVGDRWYTAYTLFYLGAALWLEGDFAGIQPLFEESLSIAQALKDQMGIGLGLWGMGQVALNHGDYGKARTLFEETLRITMALGDQRTSARALYGLGDAVAGQGDYTAACTHYQQSLMLAHELSDRYYIIWCVEAAARVATAIGQPTRAVQMFAAAATLRNTIGITQPPLRQATYEAILATARAQLDATAFATAWATGQAMTLEQMVQMALTQPLVPKTTTSPAQAPQAVAPSSIARPGSQLPDSLTSREIEVLRLIATGMTDAQVAETLIVSTRTVNAHLRSIYSKLGVTSRSAATRYAVEWGLT